MNFDIHQIIYEAAIKDAARHSFWARQWIEGKISLNTYLEKEREIYSKNENLNLDFQ